MKIIIHHQKPKENHQKRIKNNRNVLDHYQLHVPDQIHLLPPIPNRRRIKNKRKAVIKRKMITNQENMIGIFLNFLYNIFIHLYSKSSSKRSNDTKRKSHRGKSIQSYRNKSPDRERKNVLVFERYYIFCF